MVADDPVPQQTRALVSMEICLVEYPIAHTEGVNSLCPSDAI